MKRLLVLVAFIAAMVVVGIGILRYSDQFTLTQDANDGERKVLFTTHYSAIAGRHDYAIFSPRHEEELGSLEGIAWVDNSSTLFSDKTSLETAQGCSVALRFDGQGNLIGIGMVEEDGFGKVQNFAPIVIEPARIYELRDSIHLHGADCVFEKLSGPGGWDVRFGFYGHLDREQAGL